MRSTFATVSIALLVIVAGCSGATDSSVGGDGGVAGDGADAGARQVGVAVGGAQDATTFRRNVEQGYVPQPSSLTYEGLYHDYYFQTGQNQTCERRFCPSYSQAVARDPISNEREQFMTVGLNSGLRQADFERPPLDVVVVLDTSSSMSGRFDGYYYDNESDSEGESRTKIGVATDAIASMTEQLNDSDRLGVVTYAGGARTVQSLQRVGELDRAGLRERLDSIGPGGGTNLDAGMRQARKLASEAAGESERDRATRVIYVTDAMPNLGDTGSGSLQSRLEAQANEGIESTFVGVGVDFNARLAESIATVRGANYYSVDSASAFDERMTDGFDYMVTPLVYDLTLEVETDGYEIERVYGSPQAEASTGQLMHVTTLFPSRSTSNGSEGSVVLVELNRTGGTDNETVSLTASYETASGAERSSTRTVVFENRSAPYFETTGVRRAVVLTEYATLLRNWMSHERSGGVGVAADDAIESRDLGQWEQQSVELRVSDPYGERIAAFRPYFRQHAEALGTEQFEADLAVLDRLINETTATATAG